MPQVTAAIVVAQVDNAAPGGYTSGSRDELLLNKLITLTNLSNTGATSWTWEIFPAVGLAEGDYGVTGKATASCTLTPPATTGYGDIAVRLTVRGDPLPGGRPNIAVAEALLGVRAPLDGYAVGLPLVHPHESTLGGKLTFSAFRGALGRISEALRAVLLALAGVGGSDELFGVSVDGARTESGGGAATALAQSRSYSDLTLSNATTLSMAGYRLQGTGTLTVGTGCAVHNDGSASAGQTGGAGAPVGELASATVAGANGAAINSAGGSSNAASPAVGGTGGAGGASNVPQAGGSASTVTLTVTSHGIPWSRLGLDLLVCIFSSTTFNKFRGGAGGAGGGGSLSGVGGGGGGGGGLGWIRAKHVVNNGRISCRGGAGGPAGTNGGGGGGGGGGLLVIWCETWTGSPPDCNGGAGGAGNGGGVSGSTGAVGKCLVFVKGVLKFRSGFGANAPDLNELAA